MLIGCVTTQLVSRAWLSATLIASVDSLVLATGLAREGVLTPSRSQLAPRSRLRDGMYTKILVAVDGSEGSKRALAAAVGLARTFGAELYSLAVEGHLVAYDDTMDEVDEEKADKDAFFEHIGDEAARYAADHGVQLHVAMIMGDAAHEIARYAEEGQFDLLVVGNARHWHHRLLAGSTAARVVDRTPCSVLVVK